MVYGKEAGHKIGTGTGCICGRPVFLATDCKLSRDRLRNPPLSPSKGPAPVSDIDT